MSPKKRQLDFPRLVGVIHLPPLGDAPRGGRGKTAAELLEEAGNWAISEAILLQRAGFEAIIVENFGDAPFFKGPVPPETVASMSVIVAALKEVLRIPLGINILRNDARSALAVAAVTGSEFIRVNVLSGAAATDQGLIEGEAATLMRERARLAPDVRVFADVHVKHARTLHSDSIVLGAEEAIERSLADAVIVTGATTGRPIGLTELETAYRAARLAGAPLYVGSGMTPEHLIDFLPLCDGVIVGSALRKGRKAGAKLDPSAVKKFVTAFKRGPKGTAKRAGKRTR